MKAVRDLPHVPPRKPDSHKGDFGRVLVVAGSRGMSGAAILCGSAALRGGAGLVTVAIPEGVQPIVAAANPCLMTAPLPQDDAGRLAGSSLSTIHNLAQSSDVLALGPGLGRSDDLSNLVPQLLSQAKIPIVLDADGLNALAGQLEKLKTRTRPLVLTPHPGEFARLLGKTTADVRDKRLDLAGQFAKQHGVVLVVKGHRTLVTDGDRCFENTTGNPGMATAGSGDVLTGVIAALIGQGLAPFEAAQLGVHLHGLAGDLARDALSEEGLIATDVIEQLPAAWRAYRRT